MSSQDADDQSRLRTGQTSWGALAASSYDYSQTSQGYAIADAENLGRQRYEKKNIYIYIYIEFPPQEAIRFKAYAPSTTHEEMYK